MTDATDKFATMMLIGQMAKEMFQARQAEFDRSNPCLDEAESSTADLLQHAMQVSFNSRMEEQKREGADYKGLDVLELRIWAPDTQCALMQIHDHLTKEYGIFPKIALSSGLVPLVPNKLYYISLVIGKMDLDEMFGDEKCEKD
jgi:hypothetical protein